MIRHHVRAEVMEFAAGQLPAVAQRDSRRGAVRAMTTADPLDATRSVASRERLPDERTAVEPHSKRSGERCRRLAIPGGTVCVMHGGAAPQVAAAARLDRNQVSGRTADERYLVGADQLRRARRRQPGWWAAADRHEERLLSLDPRKRRTTGMKKGMEESYIEDLANRDGPVHALATREGAAKRWMSGCAQAGYAASK